VKQSTKILKIYRTLAQAYGPLHWWPAKTRFEVIVGAFLTQNTSWKNVELALKNLRQSRILNAKGIREISLQELERLIRPSGYFRQKSSRLKAFIEYLDQRHGGSLNRMFSQPVALLSTELLDLKGVGPETADAILLYAGKLPVFVVDAYTKRLFERHSVVPAGAKYESIRAQVEAAFAKSRSSRQLAEHYNEFHALLVEVGKRHCGVAPRCEGCPLRHMLPRPLDEFLSSY
jgi:endonuclease III related protein